MTRILFKLTSIFLLAFGSIAQAQDFTATGPTDNVANDIIYPLKAGASIQLQVKLKSSRKDTCTVSLDKNSMVDVRNWVTISNNSQKIFPNQEVTFLFTVKPPTGTLDNEYPLQLKFDAYDKYSNNNPFSYKNLTIIVDNTPPDVPTVTVQDKTSKSISIHFNSSDFRSEHYTENDPTSGIAGIKIYTLTLIKPNGDIQESKPVNAVDISSYYTFSNLNSYTAYTARVTATDLANNSSTSPALVSTTLPGPPTNLRATNTTYFGTTLVWDAAPGASSYEVYNGSTLVGPTAATELRIGGLLAGSTNRFSVKSVCSEGKSELSSVFAVTTLSPSISGDSHLCSTGSEYTVENLLPDATIAWSSSSNIIRVSEQGANPCTFTSGSDFTSDRGTITATVSTPEGQVARSVSVGLGMKVDIAGSWLVYFGNPGTWTANTLCGVEPFSYQWYISTPGGLEKMAFCNSSTIRLSVKSASDIQKRYHLRVEVSDGLGNFISSSTFSVQLYGELSAFIQEPIPLYSVSPNPSSSEITVSLRSDALESTRNFSAEDGEKPRISSIKVFNQWGNLVISESFSESENARVNVGSLRTGIYIVLINGTEKHTVIKE